MKTVFQLLLGVSLAGCNSVNYHPVTLDSSSPREAAQATRCPARLGMGPPCTALIQANQWISNTGIKVKKGEAYCFYVPPNQVWFDLDRRNTPPRGDKGNGFMNAWKKRHPQSAFFSLMVNTLPKDEPHDLPDDALDLGKEPQKPYIASVNGELVLYPNDAIGPADAPKHWYTNNSGQIWVTIGRCTATPA